MAIGTKIPRGRKPAQHAERLDSRWDESREGLVVNLPLWEGGSIRTNDLSEYRHTGLVANAGFTWTPTKLGMAASFDGTSTDARIVLKAKGTHAVTTGFTVEMTIRINALSGNDSHRGLFNRSEDGFDDGIGVIIRDSDGVPRFFTRSLSSVEQTGSALSTNVWYRIFFLYDGAFKKIWVNGAKDVETAITGTVTYPNDANKFHVGLGDTRGFYPFNGEILYFRLWNYGLVDRQVKALYAAPLFALLEPARPVISKAAAAAAGRIMGALAGHGGLAGPGGIAGRRGGLAA